MCSGRSSGGISSACRGAVASRRGVSLALLASVWRRVARSGRRAPQLDPDVDSSPAHRGRATDGSAGRGRNGRGGRGSLAATGAESDGRSLRRPRPWIVSGPRRQAGSRADVLLRHDRAGRLPGLCHGPGGGIELNGPRATDAKSAVKRWTHRTGRASWPQKLSWLLVRASSLRSESSISFSAPLTRLSISLACYVASIALSRAYLIAQDWALCL